LPLTQLGLFRIPPSTADTVDTVAPLDALHISAVAKIKIPVNPVYSGRVHTFPFLLLAGFMLLTVLAASTLLVKHTNAVGTDFRLRAE